MCVLLIRSSSIVRTVLKVSNGIFWREQNGDCHNNTSNAGLVNAQT